MVRRTTNGLVMSDIYVHVQIVFFPKTPSPEGLTECRKIMSKNKHHTLSQFS